MSPKLYVFDKLIIKLKPFYSQLLKILKFIALTIQLILELRF